MQTKGIFHLPGFPLRSVLFLSSGRRRRKEGEEEEEEEEAVAEKVGPDLFNVFPLSLSLFLRTVFMGMHGLRKERRGRTITQDFFSKFYSNELLLIFESKLENKPHYV